MRPKTAAEKARDSKRWWAQIASIGAKGDPLQVANTAADVQNESDEIGDDESVDVLVASGGGGGEGGSVAGRSVAGREKSNTVLHDPKTVESALAHTPETQEVRWVEHPVLSGLATKKQHQFSPNSIFVSFCLLVLPAV